MKNKSRKIILLSLVLLLSCTKDVSLSSVQERANQGSLEDQHRLGIWYGNGQKKGLIKNLNKSIFWYKKAAYKGYADSQFELANNYRDGIGLTQDLSKAIMWYERAAKKSHLRAARKLADIYSNRENSKFNKVKALYWMTECAENGDSTAQFILGRWYANGEITPRNYYLSYIWLDIANKIHHYDYIIYERNIAESKLTPDEISSARSASYSWSRGEAIQNYKSNK